MFLLGIQAVWANCDVPLSFRDALPQDGAVSVATTVRPFVSFIGTGTAEDITFSLTHLQTDEVDVDVEGHRELVHGSD